jgi:hypothetical protein
MDRMRCIGRTVDLAEAQRIAESYEAQGLAVQVIKRKEGSAFFYEIWVEEKKEGFEI